MICDENILSVYIFIAGENIICLESLENLEKKINKMDIIKGHCEFTREYSGKGEDKEDERIDEEQMVTVTWHQDS